MADVTTVVSTWDKVAAVAAAVGGVGAAIGGLAAWRAASKSSDAARDARAALAASLKPHVRLELRQYEPGGAVVARAGVVGPYSPLGASALSPATDVRIDFNTASGRQGSGSTPMLEPNVSHYLSDPPFLNVVVGEPSDDWPPQGGDLLTATVSYSDVRGVGRWRRTNTLDVWPSDTPGSISHRDPTEGDEEQIAP